MKNTPQAPLEAPAFEGKGEVLKPYVPRLLIEWVTQHPERRYQPVEGSLAFVDISGFTALTERLSRRGKIGAELMRDTLDDVFRALLDEAYDWGAGLLKWGGDALLLLFDGPGHPQRAARAAWEMQRTIDSVGRLRVAGGTVTLRMSIGITTGTIEFFTAGSIHRELLVVGPKATETVEIEAIADAGEIGISHALASCLDPRCIGPAKERALLLGAPPDVERDRAPDVGFVQGLDVASCIPVAARAHVLLERSEPEHRTITAAFIDLMCTDELLARIGRDAFADALDECIGFIQEAALQYGVPFYQTDIGVSSVKALLTAGAPSGTGHDEEAMLRALLEVVSRPGVIPIRIGVNTGKVFAGDFGPPYRRTYSVFGDAVNTAARVMSRAAAGQILATDTVLERSRTTFETEPIEPFAAKGKAEPIKASIVGGITGTRGERPPETPLIGRDAELAALLAAVDDARAGNGWVIEISGVAGVGKSRLVRELIESRPDTILLHARCGEYEQSTPYFALRAPMRTLLELGPRAEDVEVATRLQETVARVDPALASWVPLLGILLGLNLPATPESARLDERFLRETLAGVTSQFIASALNGAPAALAVEDIQFIDDASQDLLRRIAYMGANSRQVLIVTHSQPETTWSPVDMDGLRSLSLTLLPLTNDAMTEVIELATDETPLSPHDVEEIARRAAGNARFLFDLLDTVRATGTTTGLPDSIEAVIGEDIDRLSLTDRAVLRYASVLGATFDPGLLAAALDGEVTLDEGLWERLERLILPDPNGGMRFRNTLVRETAYEGLPFRRRRQLHERVAETIEATSVTTADESVLALALHYFEANRYNKAWQYCRLAGDRARAIAAHVEARRFYERALAAGRRRRDVSSADRADVWKSLGAVCDAVGAFEDAYDALRRATVLLAGNPIAQARLHDERGLARLRAGAYGRALRETAIGLRLLDGIDSSEAAAVRARLHAHRAELRQLQGRAREAVRLALRAVEEGTRVGELEAVARAYGALDAAYQYLGQPEKAVHEHKALEIWTRLGRMRAVGIVEMNLGVQAYADGRWEEAIDWYRRSQKDCAATGDRYQVAIAGANLGEVLVSRGSLDEAERVLRKSRRVLRAAGPPPYALFAETQLARLQQARGEPQEALETLERLASEARDEIRHAAAALEIVIYLADAAVASGDPERGLAGLDAAARDAGDDAALYAVPVARVRGLALAALGRRNEATECLTHALAAARQQNLLYEQLLTLRALAELARAADEDPSHEELDEAHRLAQLLGLEPVATASYS